MDTVTSTTAPGPANATRLLEAIARLEGGRAENREQPVLGPHPAWIHEVLEQDKKEPRKQRPLRSGLSTD